MLCLHGSQIGADGAEYPEQQNAVEKNQPRLQQKCVIERIKSGSQERRAPAAAELADEQKHHQRQNNAHGRRDRAEGKHRDVGVKRLGDILEVESALVARQFDGAGDQQLGVGRVDVEKILAGAAVGGGEFSEMHFIENDAVRFRQKNEMGHHRHDHQQRQEQRPSLWCIVFGCGCMLLLGFFADLFFLHYMPCYRYERSGAPG